MRVALIEKMIFAVKEYQSIGVVHPIGGRGKVKGWAEWIGHTRIYFCKCNQNRNKAVVPIILFVPKETVYSGNKMGQLPSPFYY